MIDESTPLTVDKEDSSNQGVAKLLGLPVWCVALLWIGFGVSAACYMEGWRYDTAFYVIVQVVTTIGYGDVTVSTNNMKLWTSFYVVGTLLLFSAYVTDVANSVLSRPSDFLKKHMSRVRRTQDGDEPQDVLEDYATLLASFVLFMFFVLVGTLFFGIHEACSCSFGVTRIEGCVEDPIEQCFVTGGATNTFVEAFYMSVITLTTVGFGDHSPKTQIGRTFGCVWMLLGVMATANLMAQFGSALYQNKRHREALGTVSHQLFAQIDTSKDGKLSRNEFRHYALLKFGMVTSEEFKQIDALFDRIDADKTGVLTFQEISQHCDAPGTGRASA